MEMRDCDVELFEDNPEEFIRRDLEGSDVDTRRLVNLDRKYLTKKTISYTTIFPTRRAACDLVKGLSRHFQEKITAIFGQYVKTMLDSYGQDNINKWRLKSVVLGLPNLFFYLGTSSIIGPGNENRELFRM